jgi:hypothetical protein
MTLLKDRRLATLLAAEVISSLGTQMTWVALPWFVLRTTSQFSTRSVIAAVLAVQSVAVLTIVGSALVERSALQGDLVDSLA